MFNPQSENASAPLCAAIEELRASLPAPSDSFQIGNLVAFYVFLVIFALVTPVLLFKYRNSPRFSKVRPFWVMCLISLCLVFVISMTFLRLADEWNFPCAATTIMYFLSEEILATVIAIRMLLYVVEQELQRKLMARTVELHENDSESDVDTPVNPSALRNILQVVSGVKSIDEVQLDQLAQVKRPELLLSLCILLLVPTTVAIITLFSMYPSLVHCRGCYPFSETLIAVFICTLPNVMMMMQVAYAGYKLHRGSDAQGVIKEFIIITILVVPLSLASILLEIVDPGSIDKNYEFAWEWLIAIGGIILWAVSIAWQVIIAIQQERAATKVYKLPPSPTFKSKHDETTEKRTMLAVIFNDSDPISKEFERFAARYLVVENINFLRDVNSFKKYFQDKGSTWRIQKARLLASTYVRNGAAAEINVSDLTRNRVFDALKDFEEITKSGQASSAQLDTRDLFNVFDEAYTEVAQIVLHGVWIRFTLGRTEGAIVARGLSKTSITNTLVAESRVTPISS